MMTADEARQVCEALEKAKNALLVAIRVAEGGASKAAVRAIGSVAGRCEGLQRRAGRWREDADIRESKRRDTRTRELPL